VCLDNGLDDGEPESEAFVMARAVGSEALERLEESIDRGRGHDRTGVAHGEDSVPEMRCRYDFDFPASEVVAQRVVHEVGYQALDKTWVALHRGRRKLGTDDDASTFRFGATGHEDVVGHSCQVEDVVTLEAGLSSRQGEKCLDHALLLRPRGEYLLVSGSEGLDGGVGVGQGHLGHGSLSGERGTQLVGRVGDELALGVE
jgi:hypothetical protein